MLAVTTSLHTFSSIREVVLHAFIVTVPVGLGTLLSHNISSVQIQLSSVPLHRLSLTISWANSLPFFSLIVFGMGGKMSEREKSEAHAMVREPKSKIAGLKNTNPLTSIVLDKG